MATEKYMGVKRSLRGVQREYVGVRREYGSLAFPPWGFESEDIDGGGFETEDIDSEDI